MLAQVIEQHKRPRELLKKTVPCRKGDTDMEPESFLNLLLRHIYFNLTAAACTSSEAARSEEIEVCFEVQAPAG